MYMYIAIMYDLATIKQFRITINIVTAVSSNYIVYLCKCTYVHNTCISRSADQISNGYTFERHSYTQIERATLSGIVMART